MWIQIYHYDDDGYEARDCQFEYTKDIKELTYWQNIYQCARTKTVLYHSTIEALWLYFHDKAFNDNYEGMNNLIYNRLGVLHANWMYAYAAISKVRRSSYDV